jgi:hypothetical protein
MGIGSSMILNLVFIIAIMFVVILPTPVVARTTARICSLMLNGPGLSVNSKPIKGTRIRLSGKVAAMNLPIGRDNNVTTTPEIPIGFCRTEKRLSTTERIAQKVRPRVRTRNVKAGMVGSSVFGTVKRTCSIGESLTVVVTEEMKIRSEY